MTQDPTALLNTDGLGRHELFSEFFGERRGQDDRRDYRQSHETFNLPDAYKGKNKHLEDVLDFLIRQEDEFYTERLLPWHYTDDIHVQWEIFRFNRTLMDVEPEQGVPRLVTAETERRTDNLLRRGLAFIIEHGFMTTERGRKHFMLNLQQITDAVHTTAHFGVMHALLTSRAHYKEWRRTHSRLGKHERNLMKHERDTWALVQKSPKGVHILDALLKHEMKRNGVVPDVWVFPPKMSIYLDMVPDEATTYKERGQLALNNLEEDRSLKGIRWRGTDVFEAQSFDIDFDYGDTDLMNRSQMCGEFFVIPHGTRAIKIFSADHDSWQEISYEQAYNASLAVDSIDGPDANYTLLPNQHIQYNKDMQKKIVELQTQINEKFSKEVAKGKAGGSKKDKDKGLLQLAAESALSTTKNDLQKYVELSEELHKILNDRKTKAYADFIKDLQSVAGATLKNITDFQTDISSGEVLTSSNATKSNAELHQYIKDQTTEALKSFETASTALKLFLDNKTSKQNYEDPLKKALAYCRNVFISMVYLREERYREEKEDIILFRPFQTYRMSSAVLAASGEELGSTFHGHHDFQLSDDVIRKVHLGHYTHYSKSVVKQPKRKSIAENVFAQGYVSGEGVEFFTMSELADELELVSYAESTKSLIAWKVTAGVTDIRTRTALSITGQFPEYLSSQITDEELHFENADQLGAILASHGLIQSTTDERYLDSGHKMNTVCFRGMQFTNDSAISSTPSNGFTCTSTCHGHWKGLTYPGCMAVREGMMMKPADPHPTTLGAKLSAM